MVLSAYAEKFGTAPDLAAILLGVFRFRPLADSRWMAVGDSRRTLVAALLFGLADLVAVVRADPT